MAIAEKELFTSQSNQRERKTTPSKHFTTGSAGQTHRNRYGKQNPDIEPASELLERIRAEKEQLIKEGKIKRQKPLPEITEEEKALDLPVEWEWCRIGKVCDMIYGSSLIKSQCIPNGKYPVYGSNGIVGHYDEYLTEKKPLLLAEKVLSGALNISEYPSWTTDVAYYIEESDNLDFTFFYYLLKSLNLEKMGKGI